MLGHALSLIKVAQQVKHEPRVQTNSEKLGYEVGYGRMETI